jgi:hypothetical protein
MATNKPYGDNARKEMVKDRSQFKKEKTGLYVKRDTTTGKLMDNKTSAPGEKFKCVKSD